MKRDEENNMVINFRGTQIKYRLLNILEFTSARKRMSVIVEDSNGDIYILTKGADSILMPRLNKEKSPDLAQTQTFIDQYANEGLRTLLLAQRKLEQNDYYQWNE